jgi:hypothetical protein
MPKCLFCELWHMRATLGILSKKVVCALKIQIQVNECMHSHMMEDGWMNM